MTVPTDRRYAETHEWFLIDGDVVTMGISQYAADELTDITYVELPEIGTRLGVGDTIGEVESVKATSEVFSAIAGSIVEVNAALVDHPEMINHGCHRLSGGGSGLAGCWWARISVAHMAALNSSLWRMGMLAIWEATRPMASAQ